MNFKPLLIVPPIVLAVLGYMWKNAPQDAESAAPDVPRQTVRALTVTEQPLTVAATGYGRLTPVRSWTAVSQVEGRAVSVAPGLDVGDVVDAGALLVQIDQTDYALAVAKAEANIAAAEAALLELAGQETASERLLEREARILDVAKVEFERVNRLVQNGTASPSTLDTQQKDLLNQENAVLSLQNTLSLYPAQRASADASLAVRRAELEEAQRSLENTTIKAPFRGRVSLEAVEEGQFVRVGNELVELDGISQAEVVGAFQPQAFAALAQAALGPAFRDMTEIDATKIVSFLNDAGVTSHLAIELGGNTARYPATLIRFRGSIDEETGTIGIAVRVKDPLIARASDRRPPLEFNSFVSVVLETAPDRTAIAIPRAALNHDDNGVSYVYTAGEDDALAITPVTLGPVTGDDVIIRAGLSDGMRVLLSTPRPAIVGMPLSLVEESVVR